MPVYNINKNSNLEIVSDLIKYRVPLIELPSEDLKEIESDIKRKVKTLEKDPHYLFPYHVEIINSTVIYYYEAKELKSFHYLRQLDFVEKLKYFTSLVEIAKKQKENKVTWNKYNFVVDPYEEKVKAITYETEFIKVHEKTNALEGVKELILISLTTLDSIIGKPRKVDFIDQDDDIIDFAETILLKIENLDDLENYIETKIIEYTYENPKGKKSSPEESNEKGNKLLNKKPLKKKKSANAGFGQPPKKKGKGGKFTSKEKIIYGVCGVLVILALVLNQLNASSEGKESEETTTDKQTASENISKKDNKNNKKTDEKTEKKNNTTDIEQSTEHDNDILTAYRLALTGDIEESLTVLEKIGYDNLTEQDQAIMLNIYQDKGELEKVIELDPERAEGIVNKLIAEDRTDKLLAIKENMTSENPYVEFEVAYIEMDWERVIEMKDYVEINGRKETQITEAYIKLGEFDEAEKFAEQMGNPDLIKMIETYR